MHAVFIYAMTETVPQFQICLNNLLAVVRFGKGQWEIFEPQMLMSVG